MNSNQNPSPLRYPGGKFSLRSRMANTISQNGLHLCTYIEPFAGGSGLALYLLFNSYVKRVVLNDIDVAVWAFWHSIIYQKDAFVSLIRNTEITPEQWMKQKRIFEQKDLSDILKLGFSLFFLNRTNRSGIISGAGMIGGTSQLGHYKIDCRFSKDSLIRKIERIHKYRDKICLFNLDAVDLLKQYVNGSSEKLFIYADPPYYNKGSSLYTNHYTHQDHVNFRETILRLKCKWLVTYDDTPEIRTIFGGSQSHSYQIRYSLNLKKLGSEIAICSPGLVWDHSDFDRSESRHLIHEPPAPRTSLLG